MARLRRGLIDLFALVVVEEHSVLRPLGIVELAASQGPEEDHEEAEAEAEGEADEGDEGGHGESVQLSAFSFQRFECKTTKGTQVADGSVLKLIRKLFFRRP